MKLAYRLIVSCADVLVGIDRFLYSICKEALDVLLDGRKGRFQCVAQDFLEEEQA